MKRMLAHLVRLGPALALALACGLCRAADAHDADSDADSLSDPPAALAPDADADANSAPAQELSGDILYDFLLAEIAGARGQTGFAARTHLDLARRTQDGRIARRAAEIALIARSPELVTQAARLWLELAPQSADARRLMENIERGNASALDNAYDLFAQALAQHPDDLAVNLMSLNRALASASDKSLAQDVVFRLTEPYLDYPEAYFARAQAAAIAEQFTQSREAIDIALDKRPDWEYALLFKAQLLIRTDAESEASQLLREAIERHPENREFRLAYARSLITARRFDAARVEFRALLNETPDDRDLLYTVGLLSMELDDVAEAQDLLIKVLEGGHPQADAIRIQLGQLAEKRKDAAAARKWYESVGPGSYAIDARVRHAYNLAHDGQLDRARLLLQQPVADPADQRRLLFADAQLLAEAGRAREAYALIDAALAKDNDDADLLYESAMLAERIGLLDIMEGRLRKLIALYPDRAHAYNALGYSLADRGLRLDEAEALIGRALELAPKDAFILDSVGWVAFRQGKLTVALERLEQAYALRTDPEIAAHLGEVLWQLDRTDDARNILDRARAAHPDNPILQETIRRLYLP
ncbi:MAG: tetratricopeptide repeat protein [Azoarcus sp.]|jgi:tetratricopeptide (TPR) repeat protein|nr:tetratricopeptide repeat protein [Azoarcus sp.]